MSEVMDEETLSLPTEQPEESPPFLTGMLNEVISMLSSDFLSSRDSSSGARIVPTDPLTVSGDRGGHLSRCK